MFDWSMKRRKQASETVKLRIEGMSCGGCVRHVTTALQSLPDVEVKQVGVGSATVLRDASQTTDEALIGTLAAAGYKASKEGSHDTH